MSDPRTAPYAAVRLVDVSRLADVDPGGTAILAVGARPRAPFAVSRWEQAVRSA